ncbi:MAG: zincin-like metallopeptidase domain-containing protein [Planctomycetaceae bacterium]|nr:zincin-like metallopeptidase domain-containing protein [Planctomycetaceae bacterium]
MTTATKTARTDIYTRVTDSIVEQLSHGVRPWLKPWNAEHAAGRITRPLRHNGTPYKGINILMLWASAEEAGFVSPFWLTFQQAKELGGHVKKGEHGSPVVYAATFKKKDQTDDGQETEEEIPFLKEYTVFCADQCEGLPQHFYQLATPPDDTIEPIERAMLFFEGTKAQIHIGGNRAYYATDRDYIAMPCVETFRDNESHAATLAHELTHWTRHPSRLSREFGRKRWGDAGYAMEELVAELGSAFLCADLQITPEVREDHASYIDSWLKVLKDDKRAVFSAASHASKAADFLHGLQPQPPRK